MSELKFLYESPAIVLGSSLIIGDTHFGIEEKLKKKGVFDKTFSLRMSQNIVDLILQNNCDEIIFLGDVKENITQIDNYTFQALEKISKVAKITIIRGNHDGGIEKYLKAKVIDSPGFVKGKIGLFHGHSWPDKTLMDCDFIVCGHQHPLLRIKDSSGKTHSEPAWFVCESNSKNILDKYTDFNPNIRLILLPSFNPFLGNAINLTSEKHLGPLLNNKLFKLDSALVYRLNGTCLGQFSQIQTE